MGYPDVEKFGTAPYLGEHLQYMEKRPSKSTAGIRLNFFADNLDKHIRDSLEFAEKEMPHRCRETSSCQPFPQRRNERDEADFWYAGPYNWNAQNPMAKNT
ncbi:hypothetical protein HKX42_01635 [Salinisphaera sp. USBA-960]|uniref:hypothetical protein n=1 Tax=Salinisphaera orenii TaxID=856731 RepID=UPI000DBE2C16|nr:hypothetical protein [Salifodinibacter halophilus]NNC25577.1 hypothetical protein [Salifodinibacter halophilus]